MDFFDALLVALYSRDPSIVMPNNGDISLGDVDADGQVDLTDAWLIAVYLNDPSDPSLPAGIGEPVGPAASLSPDPSTVTFADDGAWHRFTVEAGEPVTVVVNPEGTTPRLEITTRSGRGNFCPAEADDDVSRRDGQTVYLAGCAEGEATVELRRQSDGTVLNTYTFEVTGSPVDLVVERVWCDSILVPDQDFTLTASLRNQGTAASSKTTLRYYLSSNRTISTRDTQVGRVPVFPVDASSSRLQSLHLTAPSTEGIYYYGACLASVAGESAGNNCSPGFRIRVASSTASIAVTGHDDMFTDSTGRTLLYRYWVRNDWDPTVPRGVVLVFHGNARATADEIRQFQPFFVKPTLDLGLAVVKPVSPHSLPDDFPVGERTLVPDPVGSTGTRFWAPADARLIHELLQSNFNSQLTVDYDRVVFSGTSQGTCFAAKFVEFYGGIYGGGLHAFCGCFWLDFDGDDSHDTWDLVPPFHASPWRPTFQWTPFAASAVSDRFKVFVQATTGDFLYPAAVAMSRYYPEWLGLETRTDLEATGGHCGEGNTPLIDIFDWLSSGAAPDHPGNRDDTDGDGTPNRFDLDDDNDGALDFLDALPHDPLDWRDTDHDGIADARDRDADGDGVDNAEDPFPLDWREWRDTDADGIGGHPG